MTREMTPDMVMVSDAAGTAALRGVVGLASRSTASSGGSELVMKIGVMSMRTMALFRSALILGVSGTSVSRATDMSPFDPAEIRDATTRLIAALEAADPTAWVYMYTNDAVLLEPGAAPVEGRAALLEMAKSMKPLSSVLISPIRTEGQGNLAYLFGRASWVNGRAPDIGATSSVYLVMVWRKESDGQWRVAQEVFVPDSQSK